jgi:hypothetical protein
MGTGSTIAKHFASGYQSALDDIAFKIIEQGEEGAVEWILNNSLNQSTRAMLKDWKATTLRAELTRTPPTTSLRDAVEWANTE